MNFMNLTASWSRLIKFKVNYLDNSVWKSKYSEDCIEHKAYKKNNALAAQCITVYFYNLKKC